MKRHKQASIPMIQNQEPPIQIQEPAIENRENERCFWPEGKPMPEYYERPRVPCPECRRVALDNGSQAVALSQSGQDVVYLYCRSCGHRWKMGRAE